MAVPPTSESDDPIDRFLRRLTELRPGERALLRRHFDRRLAESPTALMLFYRIFPRRLPPWATETYFFVATNAMRFPPELVGGQRNLGATLRAVITADNESAITRQLQLLLDADRDGLYPRLTHTLGLLLSKRQPVNWRAL
ncbi:MAG: type I-E CRISPR-associated protein Cse2/CasB, partial [Chloroflexales bacterium]